MKPELIYVSLQKDVVSNKLGGKQHIEGTIYGLEQDFKIKLYAVDAKEIEADCEKIEIKRERFYRQLFGVLWSSAGSQILLRKTLAGLYYCVFLKCLFFLFGRRLCLFFEFNGISGDFRIQSALGRKVMWLINVLPLVGVDGVYAVNRNIRERLSTFAELVGCSIVVGENGCFPSPGIAKRGCQDEAETMTPVVNQCLDIYFFGAQQDKYHLDFVCSALNDLAVGMDVKLHLVGKEFYHQERFEFVIAPGQMTPAEFTQYVAKTRRKNACGVIPLDRLDAGRDIIPIKAMDYLTAGLPLLHSSNCLSSLPPSAATCCYQADDQESFSRAIQSLVNVNQTLRLEIETACQDLSDTYSWRQTMRPVSDMLRV